MSDLGSRLRKARERKGWSQTFVCQKLGISNSTLSGYERDYREPDADMISTFAELYEVTTDYLLGRTNKPVEISGVTNDTELAEVIKFFRDNPRMGIFFKDLLEHPEESREELLDIWDIVKKRREFKQTE